MYERYILVEGSLRNALPDGFAVDLRLAYYRGISLSLVEGFELTVDGTAVDPSRLSLAVGGRTLAMAALAEANDVRWEFSEAATLHVARPGGLASGEHDISVTELLRIAYVPGTTRRSDRKTMHID